MNAVIPWRGGQALGITFAENPSRQEMERRNQKKPCQHSRKNAQENRDVSFHFTTYPNSHRICRGMAAINMYQSYRTDRSAARMSQATQTMCYEVATTAE